MPFYLLKFSYLDSQNKNIKTSLFLLGLVFRTSGHFSALRKKNKTHLNRVCTPELIQTVRLSVRANIGSCSGAALNCAFEFDISCVTRTLETQPHHAVPHGFSFNKLKKVLANYLKDVRLIEPLLISWFTSQVCSTPSRPSGALHCD